MRIHCTVCDGTGVETDPNDGMQGLNCVACNGEGEREVESSPRQAPLKRHEKVHFGEKDATDEVGEDSNEDVRGKTVWVPPLDGIPCDTDGEPLSFE